MSTWISIVVIVSWIYIDSELEFAKKKINMDISKIMIDTTYESII
jgi:hypothetical protein